MNQCCCSVSKWITLRSKVDAPSNYPARWWKPLPDGRIVWCVRLWEVDRAVRRCVSSATIRRFCQINRLPEVEGEVDRVEGR